MLDILNMSGKIPEMVEIFPTGLTARPRAYLTPICYDGVNIISMAGWDNTSNAPYMNLYNAQTNAFTKEQLITNGQYNHSYSAVLNSTNDGVSTIFGCAFSNTAYTYKAATNSAQTYGIGSTVVRQEAAIARIGSMAYIFGGWKQDDTMLNDTLRWSMDTTAIATEAVVGVSPPARRGSFSCALDGKFYVMGGRTSPHGGDLKDFWRYDPATRTWTQLADFPVGILVGGIAVYKGQIYVLNGASITGEQQIFARYNANANRWDQLVLKGNRRMYGHNLVVAHGKLLVMWGYVDGVISKRVFEIQNL